MLTIKDLKAGIEDNQILKGINLDTLLKADNPHESSSGDLEN